MTYRFVLSVLLFFQLSQITGQVADEMIEPDYNITYQQLQGLDVRSKIDALNELADDISRADPDSCISIASMAKLFPAGLVT